MLTTSNSKPMEFSNIFTSQEFIHTINKIAVFSNKFFANQQELLKRCTLCCVYVGENVGKITCQSK